MTHHHHIHQFNVNSFGFNLFSPPNDVPKCCGCPHQPMFWLAHNACDHNAVRFFCNKFKSLSSLSLTRQQQLDANGWEWWGVIWSNGERKRWEGVKQEWDESPDRKHGLLWEWPPKCCLLFCKSPRPLQRARLFWSLAKSETTMWTTWTTITNQHTTHLCVPEFKGVVVSSDGAHDCIRHGAHQCNAVINFLEASPYLSLHKHKTTDEIYHMMTWRDITNTSPSQHHINITLQ